MIICKFEEIKDGNLWFSSFFVLVQDPIALLLRQSAEGGFVLDCDAAAADLQKSVRRHMLQNTGDNLARGAEVAGDLLVREIQRTEPGAARFI